MDKYFSIKNLTDKFDWQKDKAILNWTFQWQVLTTFQFLYLKYNEGLFLLSL